MSNNNQLVHRIQRIGAFAWDRFKQKWQAGYGWANFMPPKQIEGPNKGYRYPSPGSQPVVAGSGIPAEYEFATSNYKRKNNLVKNAKGEPVNTQAIDERLGHPAHLPAFQWVREEADLAYLEARCNEIGIPEIGRFPRIEKMLVSVDITPDESFLYQRQAPKDIRYRSDAGKHGQRILQPTLHTAPEDFQRLYGSRGLNKQTL